MLPKLDGLEVCKRLRAESDGADHHAHRPRRRARQGARPRARRRRLHHEAVLDPRVPQPRAGRCSGAPRPRAAADEDEDVIDASTGSRSTSPGGRRGARRRRCSSRTSSSSCCATLAAHPGPRLQPRACCSRRSGASADYRDPRTIDVHVRHLREKLEAEPREPEYILTVRGVGYRFRDR